MIEIKDIWFKAEDLTQSLTDKSPEYFKILINKRFFGYVSAWFSFRVSRYTT